MFDTVSQDPASDSGRAPYGLVGLIVSTALIVAGMAVLWTASAIAAKFIWGAGFDDNMGVLATYGIKQMSQAPAGPQRFFFVLLIATFALAVPPVLVAAAIRGGSSWRGLLALNAIKRGMTRKWLLVLGIGMPAYLLIAGLTIKFLFPEFRTWFFVPRDPAAMALSFLAVAIVAPVVEELFFRGWLYTSLRRSFRPSNTIAITTLLFAAAHSDGGLLYPAAILIPGAVLAIVREWTGSTLASMLAHGTYNAWAWVLVLALGDRI
ncbi:MAG: lysostaphin resistance A-like protein [Beijerinckiaceae bacterium]